MSETGCEEQGDGEVYATCKHCGERLKRVILWQSIRLIQLQPIKAGDTFSFSGEMTHFHEPVIDATREAGGYE